MKRFCPFFSCLPLWDEKEEGERERLEEEIRFREKTMNDDLGVTVSTVESSKEREREHFLREM